MSCHYDKVPAPELNFYWNSEEGFFQGADVTDGWSCPAWFPASTCASVARVVQGQFVFVNPGVHAPFFVDTALVFTGSGPDARMYFYWIDQFVCPWFRTFDQALAANPIPLPFDGTWGANDCVRAP